ncbi:polygalacturonase QRT2-like [Abrus precatorius]|uniref:endo-polygalacturonase n=1 Tax=Abrus precatorius TaxID=3816 RepID=A0A8B8LKG1_ABRPR|nr:polygalacturonase QRT2-like [Abrus precatorius]
MSPQTPIIPLFIVLASLVLCTGWYIEEPHNYQTNVEHYYPLHDGRLIKTKHRHFGYMTRPNKATHLSSRSRGTVSVDDFGAKADGRDDSEAFEKAWNEACSKGAVLVVPENRIYTLKPITFSGPCQPNTAFMIYGTIEAWTQMEAYGDRQSWIVFDSVSNFRVDGGGTFNGNGKKWWQNSCKANKNLPCKDGPRPKAVTFYQCNNLKVTNLRFKDAQQMHVTFMKCFNVIVSNLVIRAPGNSPNTDGIHVAETQNIAISNSDIGTGDDCISIISGSQNVRATDITCGPGHGISIGSLGADKSEAEVSNVIVNRATLTGTTNGVRIKTWQGGSGYARNIKFLNIMMQNVTNPIIIDQYYCDQAAPCHEQDSAVQLSNVLYQNIRGTSASEVAIKFDCSQAVPCREIYVQDVILEPEGNNGGTIATCENVRYVNRGKFFPQCSPKSP